MKDLGNTIYAFGCVVTATVLGIGVADSWFGHHQLTAFLSWVLATIPHLCMFWLVVSLERISPRRFPPPWTAELQPNYYVVRDVAALPLTDPIK